MTRIRNRTQRPLRLHLPGDKVLHLGPAQIGRVSKQALERPSIRDLINDEALEVLDEAPSAKGGGAQNASSGAQTTGEETHGHNPRKVVTVRGNR